MSDHVAALQSAYAEIQADFNADGIRITIERALSFTNPAVLYGLRIERERSTADGRPGKPIPLAMIINNPDQTPSAMLRVLADLLDQEMPHAE